MAHYSRALDVIWKTWICYEHCTHLNSQFTHQSPLVKISTDIILHSGQFFPYFFHSLSSSQRLIYIDSHCGLHTHTNSCTSTREPTRQKWIANYILNDRYLCYVLNLAAFISNYCILHVVYSVRYINYPYKKHLYKYTRMPIMLHIQCIIDSMDDVYRSGENATNTFCVWEMFAIC